MEIITDKNGIEMSKMEYYYGRKILIDENTHYIEAFYRKIAAAKETIDMLQKVNYMFRDDVRISKCLDAIKFNINFIEETGIPYNIHRMNVYYTRDV